MTPITYKLVYSEEVISSISKNTLQWIKTMMVLTCNKGKNKKIKQEIFDIGLMVMHHIKKKEFASEVNFKGFLILELRPALK